MTDKKPGKKLGAKIKGFTTEYDGFLKIRKYEIERDKHEGGKEDITWYVMERGHAVGVLAYDPVRDELVLVNEMRSGILVDGGEPFTDTLPAGMIDKGETALQAAIRETQEETGLTLKDAKVIHDKAYVSAGGTSESIAIVFGIVDASKAAGGLHGKAAERENIKVTVMKTDEFMNKVRSGEINDLKSMVAAYWLMENRPSLQMTYKRKMKAEFDAAARKKIRDMHTSPHYSPSITNPFQEMDKLAAAPAAPHTLHIDYQHTKQLTDPDTILAAKTLELLWKHGMNFSGISAWFEASEEDRKQVLLDMVSVAALRLPEIRRVENTYEGYDGSTDRAKRDLFIVLEKHLKAEDVEDLILSRRSLVEDLQVDDKTMKALIKSETRELIGLLEGYRQFLSGRQSHYGYGYKGPSGDSPDLHGW